MAKTRNNYRAVAVAFGNWCIRSRRLIVNPFSSTEAANVTTDRRHLRRALTEEEIGRLLRIAAIRPLAERGRVHVTTRTTGGAKKKRANWTFEPLTPVNIADAVDRAQKKLPPSAVTNLETKGRERALIYRMLLLTGLRKGELSAIHLIDVVLDDDRPLLTLRAEDEKNRRGSVIPLRHDLAGELRVWIADRLVSLQTEARRNGKAIPLVFPANARLFTVPSALDKILTRDLRTAGIPKRDERGRVVDVHAMRTTFGTHLSAAGVPLRVAQAAMRHSDPKLTANVYTDPALLDVGAALTKLPSMTAASDPCRETVTGTMDTTSNEGRATRD